MTQEDNLVLMKDQGTSTEDDKIFVDSIKNMCSLLLDECSDTKKDVKKKSYASMIKKASSLTIPKAIVEVSQKTNGKYSAPPKNEKDIATEATREVLKMDKSIKYSSTDEIMDIEKGHDEKNLPSDPQDEVEENESYATILTKPSLPTKTGSSSTASAKPSAASKNIDKTIYVKNVPLEATRRTLTSAVKKFGNVKHKNIQIRTIRDGHRYAFMEFNSQKAAKQAVEAGYIQFDGYECEVEYKKGDTQGRKGRDRSAGSSRGSVGDNKIGNNNGNDNGSKPVV